MGVRIKSYASNKNIAGGGEATEYRDDPQDQREVTVDGQTHHFAPNEVKNFLDDGIGVAVGAFKGGATLIQQDAVPFGTSRS